MAGDIRSLSLVLYTSWLYYSQGVSAAVYDFTCVTQPRIMTRPNSGDTYIAAYLLGGEVTLSFARTINTFTGGSALPPYRSVETPETAGDETISILRLPEEEAYKVTRIGAFTCKATKEGGEVTDIRTVIMSKAADFLPTDVIRTVSVGDTVTLSVTATDQSRRDTRWRKDARDPDFSRNGLLNFNVGTVAVSDGGIYEAHSAGDRSLGIQALMRLIVRGCLENKWDTPSCDRDCPVCFNGGICDDRSGVCICPPGFSGDFCEILLGSNRFGQDGTFRCDSGELPGTTCAGKLFCLPDPFGCSCAAGYQGIDCETECSDGTFGDDCGQTCHCIDGVACNKATGRCPGDCASGYKGINCQDTCAPSMGGLAGDCSVPCAEPSSVTQLSDVTPANAASSEIHLSWKFVSNRCAVERYQVQYQLISLEQCQQVTPTRVDGVADNYYADSVVLSTDILAYSSYNVYIRAWNEIGGGPETGINIRTGESVPTVAPVFHSSQVSIDSIIFSWNPIPCGSRGGVITGYAYEVRDTTGFLINNSTVSATSTTTVVSDLSPCTNYTFRVRAQTRVGAGPWMASVLVQTSTVAPGAVTMLSASSTSVPTEIVVTWKEPDSNNCAVDAYRIEYALVNRDLCDEVTSPVRTLWTAGTQSLTTTVTGLHPHSIYRVYVTAANSEGSGLEMLLETITLGAAPTGPPSDIRLTNASLDALSFSWGKPGCGHRNGDIAHYHYNLTYATGVQMEDTTSNTSVDFVGLDAFNLYTLTVSAINSFGSGPVAAITGRTGTPSMPESLVVSKVSQTSVTIEWNPPVFPNGNILKYVIDHRVVARPYDSSFTFDPDSEFESQEILDMSARSGTVNNLEPSTEYELQVYIVNHANIVGEKATLRQFTALARDLPRPQKPILGNSQSSSSSVTIRLTVTSTSKYVTSYQVGVKNTRTTNERSRRSSPSFGHYAENPSSYVAAELPRRLPEEFVIGDNKTYSGYLNPSLRKGVMYDIYIGAVSRINETEASVVWNQDPLTVSVGGGSSSPQEGSSTAGIAVGVTLAILAAIICVLAAVVIWRRRQLYIEKQNGPAWINSASEFNMAAIEEDQHNEPSASEHISPAGSVAQPGRKLSAKKEKQLSFSAGPIPLSSLADYIKSKKSSKSGFQHDYQSLPSEPLHPWTVAEKHENKKKNRYANIIAYDHARVVLECLDDDPHSDYINASYIHGYKQDSKYIACQGPNKASVFDIWRMVWQERVGIIIMLTNLVENGKVKCEKYWPDDVITRADLSVRKVNETVYTNYIVRTFHLSKSSEPEGEYREVVQFHYTTWPDMKPPESSSLLQFVRRVQAAETLQPGPLVVHCSAGVGRTGTFITLDSMLAQAQVEGQVDVLGFVRAMREQRIRMVQTVDQYKFIFDALLESCLTENTAIPVARLPKDYTKLMKRDRKTGTTGIEDQFQMLEIITVAFNEDKCRGGREPVNMDKNRFQDCIPVDKSRPYLMTPGVEGSTNYINATFLDGYVNKNAYIATQAPLPNTVGDIWRMVYDYKSTCIVMLNSMDNDPNVPQYWPDEGSMDFGPLTVTFRGIDQQNDAVIVRHFGLCSADRKSEEERTICHIQYLGWPSGKDIPDSTASLLKVLDAVKMWTDDRPDGPITVHCLDGLGCSGTVCALLTILGNVRQEQVLDVFQAVKKLRATRAGMVQTLSQYQLCYQVTQNYLDSNSIYENLR